MRDTIDVLDYDIWNLMERRSECCGYPVSSSSSSESSSDSSSSSSSSSSSTTPETFFILEEDGIDIEIDEDDVTFPVMENA
jgi:hypothetical protein